MSILSQVQGLPGMRAAKTVLHRVVTRGGWIPDILPAGKVIAGACTRDTSNSPTNCLQAGLLMGKIATVVNSLGNVGEYANSIMGVTTNVEAVGSTSIEASAAVITEMNRRIGSGGGTFYLIGAGVTGGPVTKELVTWSAASGTAITCTAIAGNYLAGSLICPTDGSEEMITMIPNGYPIKSTDFDGNNVSQEFPELPIECIIDSAQLLPVWPSEPSLQEWIVSRLNSAGRFFFSHKY